MAVKYINSESKKKYVIACAFFKKGITQYKFIGSKVGRTRQTVSKWHTKWRSEGNSDTIEDTTAIAKMKNGVVIGEENTIPIKIKGNLVIVENIKVKTISAVYKAIDKLLKILEDEETLKKPKDIRNLVNILQAILPYVLDKKGGEPTDDLNGDEFFNGKFKLHQIKKQIKDGQSSEPIDIGHTEEPATGS